ncbi:hypothetical protein FGG08_006591 [Glutinoglossum americanum]|uniref:Uncharacterized protein n=1 Tax=Glutinoglossum americanum TaxID=1670608 RepID=A0A9P8I718_9PEZI|nr:hypothetical protein FGG08_006591 [Glutinoglossum americanum]
MILARRWRLREGMPAYEYNLWFDALAHEFLSQPLRISLKESAKFTTGLKIKLSLTSEQPSFVVLPLIGLTSTAMEYKPLVLRINSCGVVYPAVILLNTESQLTSVFIPSNDSPDTLCPVAEHLELYLNISVTLTSQTVPSTPASAVPTPTSSTAPLTSVANTSPTTVASSVPPDPTRRFTKLDWFLGSYLPVIIAVLYRMLWSYVYANVKLMQPFFQMNAPNGRGMQAKDLFCANYLASGAAYHPIQAMFHGDRLMLWASVSYTIAGLVGSLSSEVIAVDTKTGCSGGTGPNPCPPRLVTRLTIARLIEVMLGVTAVLAVYLTTLLHNSRSGVSSDPSSLATAASLLHHPQMLAGLRSVNCMGSKTDFANSLKNQRYRLTRYRTSTGQEYGVIPDEQQNSDLERSEKLAAKKTPTTDTPRQHSSRKRVLNIRDVVFGTFILGTLAFVIAYLKDSFYEDGFNKFMNSQSFGPKFIMASIGSLIDGHWKRIERETRVFQQYRDLAPGNAKSQGTLLQPTTSGPLTTLPYSLLHHHYFLTLISFTALLSEILIIVLAGVPYSSTQLYVAFLVSTYTSIAILGLMLLTLAVTMLWWRMGNPDIPRMPDTLGVVWSYLCWSDQMLSSFKDLSSLQQEERDKRVMGWRKRYIFGEAEMMEGVQRWVLDEDGPGE